jgi:hypothetical protein
VLMADDSGLSLTETQLEHSVQQPSTKHRRAA